MSVGSERDRTLEKSMETFPDDRSQSKRAIIRVGFSTKWGSIGYIEGEGNDLQFMMYGQGEKTIILHLSGGL